MGKASRYYYVITADVINSRKYKGLAEVTHKGIKKINEEYRSFIVADFNLFRGDEIQGVAVPEVNAVQMIRRFRYYLIPLKVRVGVGRGEIEEGLDKKYSWEMNGPAFYNSREALESVKNSKQEATRFYGYAPELDREINVVYCLLDAIQGNWSHKQWEAVDAYERQGTLDRAAKELGVSAQSVNKRCLAASWSNILCAERYLEERLKGAE